MGSQSVTNFTRAKTKQAELREAIKQYANVSPVPEMAWKAAATAIGPLNKSNPFIQGLSSASVERALDLLISLAEDFRKAKGRKSLDEVLNKHNVDPKTHEPLPPLISAEVTKKLGEILSASSGKTDPATAAQDAITRTVVDVVAEIVPRNKVNAVSPEQIARAFAKVGDRGLTQIFVKNILSSLMGLSLDAVRTRAIEPDDLANIVKEASSDTGIAAMLSEELVSLAPKKPAKVLAMVDKPAPLKKLEKIRNIQPPPPPPPPPIPNGVLGGKKREK